MFFLTTTALSWLGYGLASAAMTARVKREGYKVLPDNKTKIEKAIDLLKTAIILSIPIVNLLVAGVALFKYEEMYQSVKQDMIESGKIVPIALEEPKVSSSEKEESLSPEKVNMDINSREMNKSRNYSSLSNEEKLRLLTFERERLLKNDSVETTEKAQEENNSRGAYTKKMN